MQVVIEDDPSSFLTIGIRMFLRNLSEEADEKWGLVGHRGDTHPILVLTPGGDMAKKPAASEVFDLCDSIKHQRGFP